MLDGGRSPKVPQALCSMLEATIVEEMTMEDKEREEGFLDPDPLQYLAHSFLTLHRHDFVVKASRNVVGAYYLVEFGESMNLCFINCIRR